MAQGMLTKIEYHLNFFFVSHLIFNSVQSANFIHIYSLFPIGSPRGTLSVLFVVSNLLFLLAFSFNIDFDDRQENNTNMRFEGNLKRNKKFDTTNSTDFVPLVYP